MDKTLQFQHEGGQIQLCGLRNEVRNIEPVSMDQLEEMQHSGSIICVVLLDMNEHQATNQQLPEVVQSVLDE